jgi:hypothetical protein
MEQQPLASKLANSEKMYKGFQPHKIADIW